YSDRDRHARPDGLSGMAGRRQASSLQIFFGGKFRRWAGRDFTTADPETLPDNRWLLASRWSEQRAPDAPAHLDAPRGVLRRPGHPVEGDLRTLMRVGAAGACASRGDAASRPALRSRLLPGFRRQTRPPVPKPSVAAKPSPADSCRAPPRSPAATECRAGASASGSWNAAPAYSRRRHGRKGRHALAPSSRLRRRGAPERGQIWQTL